MATSLQTDLEKTFESFQIDLIEVGNVLSLYKVRLEELLKRKLMDKGNVASGNLLASIKTRLKVNGNSYEVWLDCLKYLKFLDEGTKPHWPPSEPILKWVRDKRLPTKELCGGDLPTEKQLTYLVSRKISKEGTLPNFVHYETLQELNEEFIPKIESALKNDIFKYFSALAIHYRIEMKI